MNLVKTWWETVWFGRWIGRPYSRSDVKRQAETDGRLDPAVPSVDDEIAPWYIGAMKEHFDNIVRGILGRFQEQDAVHKTQIKELERAKAAADDERKRAEKVYDEACEHFKASYPTIPPNSVQRRITGYLLIVGFLFLLEFPMNFTAFKLFGDHANWLTGVTAAAIGGALLVLAHYLGIAWEKGPVRNRGALIEVVILLSLAVLAITSVAQLRTAYLINNPDVKIRDSATLFRAFAVFNLMLFGCAAFISRYRHMSGIELVHFSHKALRKCRHKYHRLEKQLSVAQQRRESRRVTSETDAHRATDQHLELSKLYHMYNRRVRKMSKETLLFPKYMKAVNTSVLVTLPKHFAERIGGDDAAQRAESDSLSLLVPTSSDAKRTEH